MSSLLFRSNVLHVSRAFIRTTATHSPIKLRPYQEECIDSVLGCLNDGVRRVGVSLATGGGKTVIFTQLIDRVKPQTDQATRTLIVAHRRELIEQATRHCRDLYPDKTIDIEMGRSRSSGTADITVASVASLRSRDRLQKFEADKFKLLLIDEAHHAVSASYVSLLRHFNLLEDSVAIQPALVGVSATLSRYDGRSLKMAIDHIAYHKDYLELIKNDWLSNAIFTTVELGADLSRVKSSSGDFQTASLSKAVNLESQNDLVVRSWLARAANRKSTLVFCVDTDHVVDLTNRFREYGVEAHYVTGKTPVKTRRQKVEDFKEGKYPVLLNCGVFTEGTDIPGIDCVLLVRPTKSRNLLVQMIGRGLRKHKEKENCHIFDFVGSLAEGIVTVPTLFGLMPNEHVDEVDALGMESLKRGKELKELELIEKESEESELPGHVIFTDYDTVNDLLSDTAGDRQLHMISPLAWVRVGGKHYLHNKDGSYVTVKPAHGLYEATYTRKLRSGKDSSASYARPYRILQALDLADAIRGADTFAKERMPFPFISRFAKWRKMPASESQLAYLNKFCEKEDKTQAGHLTKGDAAAMITKLKHGAKGMINKIKDEKRKTHEAMVKKAQLEEQNRRAKVKVGPVYGK
ncbi:DNA or RNA helicase of superfamily II [Piedraia hortae CBS 480.64]|uniref:DNA or RNA helicase of superfamily II n=1 Tax=Piedraia hortae CBS 480.64 TaxID=1314780 RepID=A0A6A7BZG3_9PEZI|nr:DNA or RNA helicase of superfamily II [Piedraia hortae CBS 480.64]